MQTHKYNHSKHFVSKRQNMFINIQPANTCWLFWTTGKDGCVIWSRMALFR